MESTGRSCQDNISFLPFNVQIWPLWKRLAPRRRFMEEYEHLLSMQQLRRKFDIPKSTIRFWEKELNGSVVYSNLGKIELAEQKFRQALDIETSDASAILNLL